MLNKNWTKTKHWPKHCKISSKLKTA